MFNIELLEKQPFKKSPIISPVDIAETEEYSRTAVGDTDVIVNVCFAHKDNITILLFI